MQFENITIKSVKINLGNFSKKLRKNKKLSQAELGQILGLSRLTIQNLEKGQNTTIDTLLKIFEYFGSLENFHAFILNEIEKSDVPSYY